MGRVIAASAKGWSIMVRRADTADPRFLPRHRRALCFLVSLGALLLPAIVQARPGGGNTSSGSRSGGGPSGGGFGGGSPFFFFGGGGGLIGVIVVIVIIYFVMSAMRRGRDQGDGGQIVPMDSLPPPTRDDEVARWNQSDAAIAAGVADIKARDPAFDQAHFVDRVETAYTILNVAWVKGDLSPALPFLGEGEANRLRMQLDGDRARNRRNVMEDMVLSGTRIVHVEKDGTGDVVVTRIDASASDYYTDTRTGKLLDGWQKPRPYTEYWTFARSGTAKTTKSSYLDRHCPNCGAPLELGNISVCQFCGTPVASTEYDWVLMTIDQKQTNG